MDAFSYLAVLFSIVLGLALQQVLEGVRAVLLARGKVRLYAPPLIWAAFMLIGIAQTWWAMFGLREHSEWTFAMYAAVLAQTVFLYMVAGFALPHAEDEVRGGFDLRAIYFANRRPFFGFLIAMVVSSIVKDMIVDGHAPEAENLAFHLFFIAGAGISWATAKPLFHLVNAIVATGALVLYVALLFSTI